jgi:nitrogen regulatory protein PII
MHVVKAKLVTIVTLAEAHDTIIEGVTALGASGITFTRVQGSG